MCPYVSLKQPRSGERFAAEFTHTGQRVRPDVHLQRSQADVLLLTVLTAEGLLVAPLALELLVFGQAREAQVLFMTVQALEALMAAVAQRHGWKEVQEGERRGHEAVALSRHALDLGEFVGVRGASGVNLDRRA